MFFLCVAPYNALFLSIPILNACICLKIYTTKKHILTFKTLKILFLNIILLASLPSTQKIFFIKNSYCTIAPQGSIPG